MLLFLTFADVNLEVSPQRNTELKRPSQELFLWAVLMNRQNLAKLFWKEGNVSHHYV